MEMVLLYMNRHDYKTHHTASVAVDGNASFCSHTQSTTGPVPNLWLVDLEANYKITNVNVLNRGDCCEERLQNFTISVWEYDPGPHIKYNMTANAFCICATQLTAVPGGQWANLTCTQKCVGRFVLLMSYYNDHLTLCEVQVFGNPYSGCSAYLPLGVSLRPSYFRNCKDVQKIIIIRMNN
ncbi:hypothetical protein LOTGIDRAFT_168477 [Lottia gigantea]|uniref:Fucolectin tachylectin-4 pentraxin-1 domain-containing protein n=1 Tax=Lottia gigantea TaxID=225164 RepID=V4B7M0_LOTGI|nr:hypothetical protein LOTGIDRAFT_168477 [Lottia gigantea]ESO84619.1 hypothetical protein LOTGIDRAFT_168477 [Lottia gigantea]